MVYKKHQIDAILFLLSKGFTYRDILILPIHERNNIITALIENS